MGILKIIGGNRETMQGIQEQFVAKAKAVQAESNALAKASAVKQKALEEKLAAEKLVESAELVEAEAANTFIENAKAMFVKKEVRPAVDLDISKATT